MKRAPMTRKTPLRSTGAIKSKETKPAKERKKRLRKCVIKGCDNRFEPRSITHKVCGPECATVLAERTHARRMAAEARKAAQQAKASREADRKAKRERMTIAQLAEPVRKLAQRYAVVRDWHYGCISCDKGPHAFGVVWQGSHFKSVGSNSALQFNLLNIHKACDQCNYFKAGNIAPYETRLRQKIGDEKVDWLKHHPRSREYTPEYLNRLAVILRKKIKRQEKRLGIRK